MRYLTKIILAISILLLPTFSYGKVVKGGSWTSFTYKKGPHKDWIIAVHSKRKSINLSLRCSRKNNIAALIWVGDNNDQYPSQKTMPRLIIDGKEIRLEGKIKYSHHSKTKTAIIMIFGFYDSYVLLKEFRTAQRSIGLRFRNGFEYSVSAKGSTKSAFKFKDCISNSRKSVTAKIIAQYSKNKEKTKPIGDEIWHSSISKNKKVMQQAFATYMSKDAKGFELSCRKNSSTLLINSLHRTYFESHENIPKTVNTEILIDGNSLLTTEAITHSQGSIHGLVEIKLKGENLQKLLDSMKTSKKTVTIKLVEGGSFTAKSNSINKAVTDIETCIDKQSQ